MAEASFSVQHPEYNKPFIANDLMLIKLKESVFVSDAIRNISVASRCPTAGESCLVSGWGQMASGELVSVSVSPRSLKGSPPGPEGLTRGSASQAGSPKCSSA